MTVGNLCRVTGEGLFAEAAEAREAQALKGGGTALIERLRRTADALAEVAIVERGAFRLTRIAYGDAGLSIAGHRFTEVAGGVAIAGGIAWVERRDGAGPPESAGGRTYSARFAVSTTERVVVA